MRLGVYAVIWSGFAMIVLALALIRYLVSLHEDNNIYISSAQEGLNARQIVFFSKIDAIDRWGKSLTIVALAGGLALAALYLNQVFRGNPRPLG